MSRSHRIIAPIAVLLGTGLLGCPSTDGDDQSDGRSDLANGSPDAMVIPDSYPPDGSAWNCFFAPLILEPLPCKTHEGCPSTAPVKCTGEWVCAGGFCVYGSRGICETEDACPEGTVCGMSYDWYHDPANYPDSFTGICTQNPVTCQASGDCPAFPPHGLVDGQWSCEQGVCAFPGYKPAYP